MTPAERAKVFKALSDPHRVAIVEHLAKGSQCGSDLAEALGISASLLSHHWEILVRAGILNKERVGQLRVCSLNGDTLREAMSMDGALELAPSAAAPASTKRPSTKRRRPSADQSSPSAKVEAKPKTKTRPKRAKRAV